MKLEGIHDLIWSPARSVRLTKIRPCRIPAWLGSTNLGWRWTVIIQDISGWSGLIWLGFWTPLKHVKVNWDDDIPNWMEKWKMFQTTNQLSYLIWWSYWEMIEKMSHYRKEDQNLFILWSISNIIFAAVSPLDASLAQTEGSSHSCPQCDSNQFEPNELWAAYVDHESQNSGGNSPFPNLKSNAQNNIHAWHIYIYNIYIYNIIYIYIHYTYMIHQCFI